MRNEGTARFKGEDNISPRGILTFPFTCTTYARDEEKRENCI